MLDEQGIYSNMQVHTKATFHFESGLIRLVMPNQLVMMTTSSSSSRDMLHESLQSYPYYVLLCLQSYPYYHDVLYLDIQWIYHDIP
jgi:hypothetical protein